LQKEFLLPLKGSRERKTTSLKLSVIVRILIMPDGENISVTTSE